MFVYSIFLVSRVTLPKHLTKMLNESSRKSFIIKGQRVRRIHMKSDVFLRYSGYRDSSRILRAASVSSLTTFRINLTFCRSITEGKQAFMVR